MASMMNGPEFGDHELPLTFGSVKGLRAWTLTADGLKAVAHQTMWEAGENAAECLARQHTNDCLSNTPALSTPTGVAPWFIMGRPCNCQPWIGCQDLVGLDCGCGWWAYYTGANLAYGGSVVGVIEGYGRTLEGTQGFRCQKARIRALFLPTYADLGIEEGDYKAMFGDYWYTPSTSTQAHETRTRIQQVRDRVGLCGLMPVRDEVRNKLAQQYPDTQIFNDYERMRAAWPIDPPPAREVQP